MTAAMAFPGHTRSFALNHTRDAHSQISTDVSNSPVQYDLSAGDLQTAPFEQAESEGAGYETDHERDGPKNGSNLVNDKSATSPPSLRISNVPRDLSLTSLRDAFQKYGDIKHASLSSKQRIAFVQFAAIDAAVRAWNRAKNTDIFQRNLKNQIQFDKPMSEARQVLESHASSNSLSTTSPDKSNNDVSNAKPDEPKKIIFWPNGPPPSGPKSQRREISPPPPPRRGDSYRPKRASRSDERPAETARRLSSRDDDRRGHDIYRPSYKSNASSADISNHKERSPEAVTSRKLIPAPDSTRLEEASTIYHVPTRPSLGSRKSTDSIRIVGHNNSDPEPPPKPVDETLKSSLGADLLLKDQGNADEVCQIEIPSLSTSELDGFVSNGTAEITIGPALGDVKSSNVTPSQKSASAKSPALEGMRMETEGGSPSLLSVSRFRSPLQRLKSQADDASSVISDRTSSSISSSRKKKCADCKKPESSLAALVVCTLCPRRFHTTCGDPRPSLQSISTFICGRCIKKQKLDGTKSGIALKFAMNGTNPQLDGTYEKSTTDEILCSADYDDKLIFARDKTLPKVMTSNTLPSPKALSPKSISNGLNYSPLNKFPSGDKTLNLVFNSISNANMKEPTLPSRFQEHGSEIDLRRKEAEKTRLKYKTVTCPWWQKDNVAGCSVTELECMFAHKETGIVSPNGYVKAKDWTCRGWLATGECSKGEQNCKYAHSDTGLYVGMDGKASKKHMTCYYWKTQGQCSKSETKCIYAHTDTGIYVSDPSKASQTYARHSTSSSISSHAGKPTDAAFNGFNITDLSSRYATGSNRQPLSDHAFLSGPSGEDCDKGRRPSDSSHAHDSFPTVMPLVEKSGQQYGGFSDRASVVRPPDITQVSQVKDLLACALGPAADLGYRPVEHPSSAPSQKSNPSSLYPTVGQHQGVITTRSDPETVLQQTHESSSSEYLAGRSENSVNPNNIAQDPRKLKKQLPSAVEQIVEIESEEDDYEPPEPMISNIQSEEADEASRQSVQQQILDNETPNIGQTPQAAFPPTLNSPREECDVQLSKGVTGASTQSSTALNRNKCKTCQKSIFSGDLCVTCRKASEPGARPSCASEGLKVADVLDFFGLSGRDEILLREDGPGYTPRQLVEDISSGFKQSKRKRGEDAMFASYKRPRPNPKASYNSTVSRTPTISGNTSIQRLSQQFKESNEGIAITTYPKCISQPAVHKEGVSPSTESNKENRIPPQSATESENTIPTEFEPTRPDSDHDRSSSEEPLVQASLRRRNILQSSASTAFSEKSNAAPTDQDLSSHISADRQIPRPDSPSLISTSGDDDRSQWHTPKSRLGGQLELAATEYVACSECRRKHVVCDHKSLKVKAQPSPAAGKPKPACRDCNRRHKKCLHDQKGNFDPQTCYIWLTNLSQKGKRTAINERGKDERTAIEEAAEVYRSKIERTAGGLSNSSQSADSSDSNTTITTHSEMDEEDEEAEMTESHTDEDDTMTARHVGHDNGKKVHNDMSIAAQSLSRRSSTSYFDSETDELALSEPPNLGTEPKFDRTSASRQQSSIPPLARSGVYEGKRVIDISRQSLCLKEKDQQWTESDEETAILQLKHKGVVFESDDDNEDYDSELIPRLDQHVYHPTPSELTIDPLRSRCRTSKNFYDLFPDEHPRMRNCPAVIVPKITKGQGLKQSRLVTQRRLQYNRQMFGNANWEVDRRLNHHLVETVIERKVRPKENDRYAPDIVETTTELISFRAFLGLPEEIEACLIGQGRGATLAFREASSRLEKDLGIFARKRRIGDGEKWPVQDRWI